MQRFGAFYRDFAHALLAFCANLGRKAIKSTILVAKPLESGECRFKPVFVRLIRPHFVARTVCGYYEDSMWILTESGFQMQRAERHEFSLCLTGNTTPSKGERK